jgi:hypothetical protein
MDFGFTRMDNQISWRFPIAFQAVFATISIVGMFFVSCPISFLRLVPAEPDFCTRKTVPGAWFSLLLWPQLRVLQ